MEKVFVLKYDGSSASNGEMNAYDVADAIRGFSDFSRQVGEGLYGNRVDIRTTVRDFRHGSFEVELLFRLLSPENMATLKSIIDPTIDFFKIIQEVIKLIKHLRGDKPVSVKKADNGGVVVENNSGSIITVNQLTINLTLDPKTGRATQNFVKRPLDRSANDVTIVGNGVEVAKVTREEAQYFVPTDRSDLLTEHTSDMYVTVGTSVFHGRTKWKFHDGRNTFAARIDDQEFLDRIEKGEERFGKGDRLYVRMRCTQKQSNGILKAEYVVEEVISHIHTRDTEQGRLLL